MGFFNLFKSNKPKLGEHKLLFLCFYHYSEFIKSKKIDVSEVNMNETLNPNQNYSLYINEDDFINLTKSFIDILNVLEKKYRLLSIDIVKKMDIYSDSKFNSNELEIDFTKFKKYIDGEYLNISNDVYVQEVYQTLIFVQKLSSYYSKNGEKKGSESIFVFSFIGTHGFLFFKNINSSLETYKDSKITEVLDL